MNRFNAGGFEPKKLDNNMMLKYAGPERITPEEHEVSILDTPGRSGMVKYAGPEPFGQREENPVIHKMPGHMVKYAGPEHLDPKQGSIIFDKPGNIGVLKYAGPEPFRQREEKPVIHKMPGHMVKYAGPESLGILDKLPKSDGDLAERPVERFDFDKIGPTIKYAGPESLK